MFQLFAKLFGFSRVQDAEASSGADEHRYTPEKPAASVSSVKVMLILSVMTISLLAMSR